MARSAAVGRIACLLLALAALGGCEGKTIHLGDGRDGAVTCNSAPVPANQVLWIGDSWVLVTGSQHTRVRDLARDAGAVGANEDYVIAAQPAAFMADIVNQYAMRQAGATKVKVVIMDGGTWDTIVSNTQDTVNGVANTFTQFLAQAASDGTVEHVVYFLMPEIQGIPGVAALRPLLRTACMQSATVQCHFIDLDGIWSPDYTTAGAVPVPNEAGSQAIADAIWAVMRQFCIAQ